MESRDNLTAGEKIEEALVECLKEKMKIEDLTVAYLAKRAGVGKSTFYRHYKDIYDVYEQLVDGFVERCESLITKIFFEETLTIKEVIWLFMKNGFKKDNEFFYARDAVLINHSIEKGNAKVIEILYQKLHKLVAKVGREIYDDDEAAGFGATFILNGNIIPILSELHSHDKLNLDTAFVSIELFEKVREKWKQQ